MPKFKEIARSKFQPRILLPGDTVNVVHEGKTVCTAEINKEMEVDTATVFQFEDWWGMKEGVGGTFGKSK